MAWIKHTLILLVIYALALFITLSWYVIVVSQVGHHLQSAEVILVLGGAAPNGQASGMLRERLHEAVRLYNAGYAPYILVSGGVGEGDALSEAAIMRRHLIEYGVPSDRILVENRSRRTWENLSFSKQILDGYNFSKVILVTSGFHMARALFTAETLGYKNIAFSRSTSRVHDWEFYYNYLRESVGLCYYLLARHRLNNNPSTQKRYLEVPYIPQHIIYPPKE